MLESNCPKNSLGCVQATIRAIVVVVLRDLGDGSIVALGLTRNKLSFNY